MRVEHVNNVKGYVFGARVLRGAERHRQSDDPDWFNSFSTEAIEGIRQFFELFSIKAHFVKGYEEKDFSLATIID
jgi:hypothetical protein